MLPNREKSCVSLALASIVKEIQYIYYVFVNVKLQCYCFVRVMFCVVLIFWGGYCVFCSQIDKNKIEGENDEENSKQKIKFSKEKNIFEYPKEENS